MKKAAVFLFLFLLLPYSMVWAVDLNAPAEKKVTVGSEILRGSSAIFNATLKIEAANILGRLHAIDAVFDLERQTNTDTEAFLLGASLLAWLDLDNVLNSAEQSPNSVFFPPGKVQLVENSAKSYFNDFRKIQKQLNLDDKTICEATHLNYSVVKSRIYKWEKSHSLR